MRFILWVWWPPVFAKYRFVINIQRIVELWEWLLRDVFIKWTFWWFFWQVEIQVWLLILIWLFKRDFSLHRKTFDFRWYFTCFLFRKISHPMRSSWVKWMHKLLIILFNTLEFAFDSFKLCWVSIFILTTNSSLQVYALGDFDEVWCKYFQKDICVISSIWILDFLVCAVKWGMKTWEFHYLKKVSLC